MFPHVSSLAWNYPHVVRLSLGVFKKQNQVFLARRAGSSALSTIDGFLTETSTRPCDLWNLPITLVDWDFVDRKRHDQGRTPKGRVSGGFNVSTVVPFVSSRDESTVVWSLYLSYPPRFSCCIVILGLSHLNRLKVFDPCTLACTVDSSD